MFAALARLVALVSLCVGAPSVTHADSFAGWIYNDPAPGVYQSRAYLIDSTGPSTIDLGLTDYRDVNAAATASDGTVYTSGRAPTVTLGPNFLIHLDGGPATFVELIPDPFSSATSLQALAVHPTTGEIYASVGGNRLATIDPGTGRISHVDDDADLGFIVGMSFADDGVLYGWDATDGLAIIGQSSGLSFDVNPAVGAPVSIGTIEFGAGGVLYGASNSLYTIDTATGVSTWQGGLAAADQIRAMAILPVPEPGTFGLQLGGLLLSLVLARRDTARPAAVDREPAAVGPADHRDPPFFKSP